MEDIQKFPARIPSVLYARMKASAEQRGISLNAFVVEACRTAVDGPQVTLPSAPIPSTGKPTAQEIAARFGIKTGATLEEVEPGVMAVDDPAMSDDERQRRAYVAEFGSNALKVMLRMPSYLKMPWPKRFEATREQREREAGS